MNLVDVQIPQPDNSAASKAEQALARAEAMTITTPEMYRAASDELRSIKAKYKEIDEHRKSLKRPIDEAAKRIQAFFAGPLEFLSRAESIIKRKMIEYDREQERIRLEEQRKADEAARRERARLEAQARKAEASGKVEKAAELEQRAAMVTPPVLSRPTPKVEGIAKRTVWRFRIVDPSKVPEQYKTIDERKIAGVVKALGADANIPGVEVYADNVIAART